MDMKNSSASKVSDVCTSIGEYILTCITGPQIWDAILVQYRTTEITQKQVYAYWQHINEDSWRLNNDQVESAHAVLAAEHGVTVNIIPIEPEDGISVIAFAMKEAVDVYAAQVAEVAMDSTCKFTKSISGYQKLTRQNREDKCCRI